MYNIWKGRGGGNFQIFEEDRYTLPETQNAKLYWSYEKKNAGYLGNNEKAYQMGQ